MPSSPHVQIRSESGRKRLYVHNRPFLALGIQYDFLHTGRIDGFDYLFDHTVRMGLNTVFFPIRWFEFERSPGTFDFTIIDHVLARCREHNLMLSLLWFGANQGGMFRCAPEWLRNDTQTYRRLIAPDGQARNAFCPLGEPAVAAEKTAFDALLSHIAIADTDRRCIFLQIENEPCLEMNARKNQPGALMDPYTARCHCPVCNERLAESGLGEWEFAAECLLTFFRRLLADRKRILPALAYTNFLINPQRAGEDLDAFLDRCPELDLIGADYYGFSAADLAFTMRFFDRSRNVPFIAEHSTESTGDAGANLWRAVCDHGAIAFDPWAIDHTFGWRHWRDRVHERPLVARDGSWTDAAIDYGRSARTMALALEPLAQLSGTPDMMHYIADHQLPRNLEERRWGMVWRMLTGPAGRWAILRTAPDDFTLVGVQTLTVLEPTDTRRPWQVESGRWSHGQWHRTGDAPVVTHSGATRLLDLGDGACVRIRLATP